MLVRDVQKIVECIATSVYGLCISSERSVFLAEFSQVASRWESPWVLGGDFNIIRFSNERKRGCIIGQAMKDFSDWIRHHELVDLPLGGTSDGSVGQILSFYRMFEPLPGLCLGGFK